MRIPKNILLLSLTNIAIMVFLMIIAYGVQTILGVYIADSSYLGLWVFALIFGFGGAYINLSISRWLVKRVYNIRLIQDNPINPTENMIYTTIVQLSQQQEIPMPQIGIYQSKECNAFATGPSKSKSLIAVSTWLLKHMNREEIKWVLAHEFAHIQNGDMITMTLLQWIINTFVIFASRLLARIISITIDEDGVLSYGVYIITSIILDIFLGLAGTVVLAAYSRTREYRADEASAQMVWPSAMIAALRKLQSIQHNTVPQDEFATLKMIGGKKWLWLFSTHPPLEKRIENLQS